MAGFAVNLVRHFGRPITATSANRSGRPAAVTAEEVRAQLDERIDALIDGGPAPRDDRQRPRPPSTGCPPALSRRTASLAESLSTALRPRPGREVHPATTRVG